MGAGPVHVHGGVWRMAAKWWLKHYMYGICIMLCFHVDMHVHIHAHFFHVAVEFWVGNIPRYTVVGVIKCP